MFDSPRSRHWRFVIVAFPLFMVSVSFAGEPRPTVQRFQIQDEQFIQKSGSGNLGGVAQSGVAAAIYRSTGCGFQSWIGGQPSWLDEMILFNDGGNGAPLRSMNFSVCYDTCHRGNRCTGQVGPRDCDCLQAIDLPITATFQMWDGDPCGSGAMIAGAGASVQITSNDIPADKIFDNRSNCFVLSVAIDPKVQVPHNAWVEANYGHDDSWPLQGRPNDLEGQGQSPLSGLNNGVDCNTFCDFGDPALCSNDENRCDWILSNADSNAEIVFTLQPRSGGAGPVVGQEIILTKGDVRVDFDVFVSDFDPQQTGIQVQAYSSQIDSSGYTSGLNGVLTPVVIACDPAGAGDQCSAANLGMGDGSVCNAGSSTCEAAYVNCVRPDSLFDCTASGACDVSTLDYLCGAALLSGGVSTTGADAYLWSLALDVSPDASGTFTIDLELPPDNLLISTDAEFLPLLGVVPGQVTIQTGQCCSTSGSPPECLGDLFTANQCAEAGGNFDLQKTCDDPCAFCGDGILNLTEVCDGSDDAACPGLCRDNCACPFCGDDILDPATEECDGSDASACPKGICIPSGEPGQCLCPLPHDNREQPEQITCPFSTVTDSLLATTEVDDPGLSCMGGLQGAGTLWYTFTLPLNVFAVELSTCSTSSGDTVLAMFEQQGDGSLVEIACANNECGSDGLHATTCVEGLTDQKYLIQVASTDPALQGEIAFDVISNCGRPFCGDGVINQTTEFCDGSNDEACPGECRLDCTCPPPPPIPTLGAWGMAITVLLLLAAAKIYFARRWAKTGA